MKNYIFCSTLIIVLGLVVACNEGVQSPRGFSLPEGDVDAGRTVFLNKNCLACHALQGYEAETEALQLEIDTRVPLGGQSAMVTTYAELVTSIINPSHKISRGLKPYNMDEEGNSLMPNYNQQMTVQELIDIVAFLQPEYKVQPYQFTRYQTYPIY